MRRAPSRVVKVEAHHNMRPRAPANEQGQRADWPVECQVLYVPAMWIKICGLTEPDQARAIAALAPGRHRAEFLCEKPAVCLRGGSPTNREDAVGPQIERIGVFVEPSAEELRRTVVECRLERRAASTRRTSEHALAEIAADAGPVTRRICGFQVGHGRTHAPQEYFKDHGRANRIADAYLVDALVEGMYGGTGKIASVGSLCETSIDTRSGRR